MTERVNKVVSDTGTVIVNGHSIGNASPLIADTITPNTGSTVTVQSLPIDNTGNVSWSHACHLSQSSPLSGFVTGNTSILSFDTIDVNTSGGANLGGNRIGIQETGLYMVSAYASWNNPRYNIEISLVKNASLDSIVSQRTEGNASPLMTLWGSGGMVTPVYLTSSDYIQMTVTQNNSPGGPALILNNIRFGVTFLS